MAILNTYVLTPTLCIEKLGTTPIEGVVAMPELPSHHDTGSEVSKVPIAGASRRRRAVLTVLAIALVVLAVVLHLTGVLGGESHS
jgi:hypothetical protein